MQFHLSNDKDHDFKTSQIYLNIFYFYLSICIILSYMAHDKHMGMMLQLLFDI